MSAQRSTPAPTSAFGLGKYPLLDALLAQLHALGATREAWALASWAQPCVFYPFQADWAFEQALKALYLKSRQIGITHASAAWATLRAVFFGETTSFISKTDDIAYEAAEAVQIHASLLAQAGSLWALGEDRRALAPDGTGGARVVGNEIAFASGGRVIAHSAGGSGARSFSGNVILDELAHQQHADDNWKASVPATTHGYSLRVLSSPNGVGNKFHDLCTRPESRPGWAFHQTTVHDAVAQGMRLDLAELRAGCGGDPRVFAQEYECSFLDGDQQYLPTDAIRLAQCDSTAVEHAVYYAGMDFGLRNDLSAIVVGARTADGRVWVQADPDYAVNGGVIETFKRTAWHDQEPKVVANAQRWGWKRMCFDETGGGMVPAANLQRLLGRMRVEPVNFTPDTKEALATGLYQALTTVSPIDGLPMLHLPKDDALFLDLCSLRRMITPAGNVRYDTEHNERGHGDRAWAVALMLMAISFHRMNKSLGTKVTQHTIAD